MRASARLNKDNNSERKSTIDRLRLSMDRQLRDIAEAEKSAFKSMRGTNIKEEYVEEADHADEFDDDLAEEISDDDKDRE